MAGVGMGGWDNAVQEFRSYLDGNPDVKSALYKVSATNANIYNNPEVQQGFAGAEVDSGMKLSDSAMGFFTETVQIINQNFKRSDEMDIDINHFIDERASLLSAVSEGLANNDIALDQSFREIAFKTNRTPEEALVYETAEAFLEPSELSQAITDDLSVGAVLGEVEQSRIRQFMKIFVNEEYQQERTEDVEKIQDNLENPLSAEMGFMKGLEENFNKASIMDASHDDIKSPDATPKVQSDDMERGR